MAGQSTHAQASRLDAAARPGGDPAALRIAPRDRSAGGSSARTRLFADEHLARADRLRLAAWGCVGLAALTGALVTANSLSRLRHTGEIAEMRIATLQSAADEQARNMRQLTAAIETLGSDRDRVFARLTIAEKTIEDVNGSLTRQMASVLARPSAERVVSAVADAPVTPATAASETPADAATTPGQKDGVTETTASIAPEASAKPDALPLPQARPTDAPQFARLENVSTEPAGPASLNATQDALAVDVGGGKSMAVLRAMWRDLSRKHAALLAHLQPLVAVRERKNAAGMDLRLIVGPVADEDTAKALCAAFGKSAGECRTTPFDGQRLMPAQPARTSAPLTAAKPEPAPASNEAAASAEGAASEDRPPGSIDPTAAAQAAPKVQSRIRAEPARTAAETGRNPLERLLGIKR